MRPRKRLSVDALVTGGGIIGLATAYYLSKRGVKVAVLERRPFGFEASGRSAGGVRQQGRDTRELPLAIASVGLWDMLEKELGAPIHYRKCGNVIVALTEAEIPKLAAAAECEQDLGLRVDILSRRELVAKIPALSDRCVGGKYCPTDGIAEPSSVVQALAGAASQRGALLCPGAEALDFRVEGNCVTSVLTDETEFLPSVVVNAAGPWAPLIAMRVGIVLPIWPVRAQLAETGLVGTLFNEFVTFPGEEIYCRPTVDGRFHIGPYAWVTPTDVENPSTLIPAASYVEKIWSLVPALKDVPIDRSWSGLLDATPDALPIIGPVPRLKNYFVAAGFSGHGFCLGPIVGQLLSELIVDGKASMSLDAFSLSRFRSERTPAESALR